MVISCLKQRRIGWVSSNFARNVLKKIEDKIYTRPPAFRQTADPPFKACATHSHERVLDHHRVLSMISSVTKLNIECKCCGAISKEAAIVRGAIWHFSAKLQ